MKKEKGKTVKENPRSAPTNVLLKVSWLAGTIAYQS